VAQAAPAASPAPSPTPPPHLLQVSGFADAGYTAASTASAAGTPGGRTIEAGPLADYPYVFDSQDQQIQFHNFNLQAAYNGPIGGKVEASFGDDANVINSYPKGIFAPGTDVDLTQAYLSVNSGQFTGIAGKFETLAGAEVIESPNDLDFSRSILFGYAVPFTHTGVRLTWAVNPTLSLIGGINRGWDTTTTYKNNTFPADTSSLTAEGGVAWNPSKLFSATVQGYDGTVEEGYALATPGVFVVTPARPVRSLIDTVLTYHAGSALTITVNGDDGAQTNSNYFNGSGALAGYGTDTWSGVAGYVNYVMSPLFNWTIRAETFGDYGGSRTGITQHWEEGTYTLQYNPGSNIIIRGEVRADHSDQLFFIGANGAGYHTNSQFGIETILKYP
jgi:hypothetical protein